MRLGLAALAVCAAPLLASGQEAAPALQEDPRAARFREVERGPFAGFEIGYLRLLKTPVANPQSFPYAGTDGGAAQGFVSGLHVGYDLSSRLSASLFFWQGNATAGPSYGAFSVAAAGADLRFGVLGLRDSNEVERIYLYLHARAGQVWASPKGLFGSTDSLPLGSSDFLGQGGLGVEYYTRLRHFSVGVMVDGLYFTHAKAAGVSAVPTLRYTF